jgi:hypothetical protein
MKKPYDTPDARRLETYNPLRHLTVSRAVALLEDAGRGALADLQWTYRAIERRDATLRALKHLRLSAVGAMQWSVRAIGESPEALAQRDALKMHYEQCENIAEAVRWLGLAEFRGVSALWRETDKAGTLTRFIPVPHWHLARAGFSGEWLYSARAENAPRGVPLKPADVLLREVDDPIDEVALIAFIRKTLSQKDWDGFVETFGIPSLVVNLPADVPDGKAAEYQEMCEAVAGGSRITLPAGAVVTAIGSAQTGTFPFREHLDYQDEQVVRAGTSGKLTMLTSATGIGSGAADTHADTFATLAKAEATAIAECFQSQIDKPFLAEKFPGQKVLAYFDLAPEPEDPPAAPEPETVQAGRLRSHVSPPEDPPAAPEPETPLKSPETPLKPPGAMEVSPEVGDRVAYRSHGAGIAPAGVPEAVESELEPVLEEKIAPLASAATPDAFADELGKLAAAFPVPEGVLKSARLASAAAEAAMKGIAPHA